MTTLVGDAPGVLADEAARTVPPCAVVLVGATGDLARRRLLPALYALAAHGVLGDNATVIGASRVPMSEEDYRRAMRDAVSVYRREPVDDAVWRRLAASMRYVVLDPAVPDTYGRLHDLLEWSDSARGTAGNRLVHLAIPPSAMAVTVQGLSAAGVLARRTGLRFCRLIVEKPFGRDLDSARELNRLLHRFLDESQIFRIDHYLAKESVQNLLALRFANSVFEPVWNRENVNHVQITVAETVGVEGRGAYYEESGALRDMVQSHLLQVLSLVGMEPPIRLSADSIRDEKVKLLRAIPDLGEEDVLRLTVRGQYGPGCIEGRPVPGYREEPPVDPHSLRETYAALRVDIDNWRWAGTPFYIRTGKRLHRRVSEIGIHFRRPPHLLFPTYGAGPGTATTESNLLIVRIYPDEGVTLLVNSKKPGAGMRLAPVGLDFWYGYREHDPPPDAYERLLVDALRGDAMLFAREDEVEEAWRVCTAVLRAWAAHPPAVEEFPNYRAGTWGPPQADELLARDGRVWRNPSGPSLSAIADN
jgi:glucose-6-phosphate 1-dehydrogenase